MALTRHPEIGGCIGHHSIPPPPRTNSPPTHASSPLVDAKAMTAKLWKPPFLVSACDLTHGSSFERDRGMEGEWLLEAEKPTQNPKIPIQTACYKKASGLRRGKGNEIGLEIGPDQKSGKKQPKQRKSGEDPVLGCFFYFLGGTYFRTYFVSYFGPKARNLFCSRPPGLQIQKYQTYPVLPFLVFW